MLAAKITLEYSEEETARAVAEAISPDNTRVPKGLKIRTWIERRTVFTEIRLSENKLPTFIATIEDLLRSVSVAERAIFTIRKRLENQL
jgi:tRNA threonylcarbamoyladenosine modification (KEOPS) complex  Pcc1 subunit